jgi:UDP-glucose 4-epimerase
MKILFTGACGFIGSHVLLELLRQDDVYEILVIDNLSNSSSKIIDKIIKFTGKPIQFLKVDLKDQHILNNIVEMFQPEIVFHFAGLKSVKESQTNPNLYFENNVQGTKNLLESLNNTNCTKIIFSSSATVYGNPIYLPYDEIHPTRPQNNYGKTKLICEDLIEKWKSVCQRRSAVILRYFNPVGVHSSGKFGEHPKNLPNNLFPIILRVIVGKLKVLKIYGNDYETSDGTAERDYIHIMDLAKAHVASLRFLFENNVCQKFNLGTGKSISVLTILKTFEKVYRIKIPYKFVNRRDGDLPSYWTNSRLSRQKLNWKPKYSIFDACIHSLKWTQNQQENKY